MQKLSSIPKHLPRSRNAVLLIVSVIIVTILASATIAILLNKIANLNIPSLGTIVTVDVEAYWDGNLINKAETVNWGMILPGSSRNAKVYLRSMSNVKSKLNLSTTDWIPANISEGITLSWDYNDSTINPGEVVQVTLTLSASNSYSFIKYLVDNNVREFNFTIIIRATEY